MRGVRAIGVAVCGFFLRLCSNCEVGAACELPDRVLGTDSGAPIGTTNGTRHRCDAWLPLHCRLPPGFPKAPVLAGRKHCSSRIGVALGSRPVVATWRFGLATWLEVASTSGTRYYLPPLLPVLLYLAQ